MDTSAQKKYFKNARQEAYSNLLRSRNASWAANGRYQIELLVNENSEMVPN